MKSIDLIKNKEKSKMNSEKDKKTPAIEYGLIGARLGHSFSREIHALIADYDYTLCELDPRGVAQLLEERRFCAINVTIPYKETVIPLLDSISPEARRIGAVNTIVNRGGRLYGFNTDYSGARALLAHAGIDPRGRRALVLGSGGTSKTLCAVLKDGGAGDIRVVSRTPRDGQISYEEAYAAHADAELIVNTTPVGMYPNVGQAPIDISRFPRLCGVADVIYNPLCTLPVLEARARGIPAEGGLYMLAAQAVYASALFLGREADPADIDRVWREVRRGKQNIVLIGMPSCGKSSIGRRIAELTGRRFIDTDERIVSAAGREIPAIFAERGEAGFRALECEAVAAAAVESGAVIATGGGAVLNEKNLRALRQNGVICFIDRPLSMLCGTPDRPLAQNDQALAELYARRYPIYTAAADLTVPGDGTVEETAKRLLERVRQSSAK